MKFSRRDWLATALAVLRPHRLVPPSGPRVLYVARVVDGHLVYTCPPGKNRTYVQSADGTWETIEL